MEVLYYYKQIFTWNITYGLSKKFYGKYSTVVPRLKRHAGISEGEHILRNVFMLTTGMPVWMRGWQN